MALITQIITQQLFEFIRLRILEILVTELENQAVLQYDEELSPDVFVERTAPLDKTELDAIIVTFAEGEFSNKHQGSTDGSYQYFVDCYTSAKSSADVAGDTLANTKLQKIMGVVRSILEDPVYKTLGVAPPVIMKSYVSKISVAPGNKEDALNTGMGRLVFNVVANETNKLIIPPLLSGYQTQVKVNGTGKGYFYEGISYT